MKFPCGVRAGTGRGPQRGSRAGVLESTFLTREVAGCRISAGVPYSAGGQVESLSFVDDSFDDVISSADLHFTRDEVQWQVVD